MNQTFCPDDFEYVDITLPNGAEERVFLVMATVLFSDKTIPGHQLVAVCDSPDHVKSTDRVHCFISSTAFTWLMLEVAKRNTQKYLQLQADRDFDNLIPDESERVYKYDPATRVAKLAVRGSGFVTVKLSLDKYEDGRGGYQCQLHGQVLEHSPGLDKGTLDAVVDAIVNNDLCQLVVMESADCANHLRSWIL
jgi:hypothetical protein